MHVRAERYHLNGSARDVLRGLTSRPKWLPAKLFYDAAGSALFEQITTLPEYYLTATEQGIFERHAREMLSAARCGTSIVELGAGTAKKTMLLLRAALDRNRAVRFIPVDLSSSALRLARQRVRSELPQVAVQSLVLDFTESLSALSAIAGPKLVLFLGSSIGNFEPMAASALLRRVWQSLEPGDALLLGTDMRKPVPVLLRAYDDAAGVTAQFNLNLLARLNRELHAEFDLECFAHQVRWNDPHSRIEMHLTSRADQRVAIRSLDLSVAFSGGETIHTENCYKYTPEMIDSIAHNGGFAVERAWSDEHDWFRVNLLRR
jgi:L-histidine Nalpha-methyltransferase